MDATILADPDPGAGQPDVGGTVVPASAPFPAAGPAERPFKAALLYEDPAASRRALAFAFKLARGLCANVALQPLFWRLDVLGDPTGRKLATDDLAGADAVIVTFRTAPLDAEVEAWINRTVSRDCIVVHLHSCADGNWSITIRHKADFSLGRVGATPETVEVFRCGYQAPILQSA